ncbi:coiled-coil domain-containing protein 89 [Patella vulgata]|uniref:coiled-coil domain-containing protein 89 n=1 Tax=Patella vulgata TaxID=6465 RepID=UPI00217FA2E7|nr:coiled-coil domain-containing protein 89 [Patella vulgata]
MESTPRQRKELNKIVTDSNQDVNDMQSNLAKLRALSEDDKTEAAMLRSRIDEQGQLIMVLKQRTDESVVKAMTLDKINTKLTDERDRTKDMLNQEIRKFNILDNRFHDLASNHEEMIKIKDEYKRVNVELRNENAKLREENSRLFSGAILEKDQIIGELDTKIRQLQEQSKLMEQRIRQQQSDFRNREEQSKKELQTLQDKYRTDLKSLQQKLQDSEERLKGLNYKLQMQIDGRESQATESSTKLNQITKQRDELLDLAMQRGKLIQKEQTENKLLQKKIEEMDKSVKAMEEKFERQACAVNANLQVKRLKEDLNSADNRYTEMTKEFDAFKKHSNNLLQKERELNQKLRHLVG